MKILLTDKGGRELAWLFDQLTSEGHDVLWRWCIGKPHDEWFFYDANQPLTKLLWNQFDVFLVFGDDFYVDNLSSVKAFWGDGTTERYVLIP